MSNNKNYRPMLEHYAIILRKNNTSEIWTGEGGAGTSNLDPPLISLACFPPHRSFSGLYDTEKQGTIELFHKGQKKFCMILYIHLQICLIFILIHVYKMTHPLPLVSPTLFSSPELKAQVSFSDHLSSVVCLSVRPSVRLSVRPSVCL